MLGLVRWQAGLEYRKNILIFSTTTEKHISYVKHVLTLLEKAPVTMNLKSNVTLQKLSITLNK